MAWIESHQSLKDHPKTRKLSRILGTSLPATIGHLQCLWWWSIDYAEDGDLSRHDAMDIAIGGEWDGDPLAFVNALVSVGFLDRVDDLLIIHDWNDYAGKLIERRKANAERMREARARREASTTDARETNDADTNTPRASHVQRTTSARAERPTVPTNRTEQNQQEPDQPAASQPARAKRGAGSQKPPPRKPELPFPDDLQLTDAMRDYALRQGVTDAEAEAEFRKFRNHAQANDRRQRDWGAAWRAWVDNAISYGHCGPGRSSNVRTFTPRAVSVSAQDRTKAAFDEVLAELEGYQPDDASVIEAKGAIR